MGNNAPDGYLKCDGTEYKINDYKNLAEQIKKEFGSYNYFGGDGTITFAVSNLQGEFLRGTGTNSHTNQGDGTNVGVHQNGTQIPYFFSYGIENASDAWISIPGIGTSISDTDTVSGNINRIIFGQSGGRYINGQTNTYFSIRPTNTSVLYCIKY